MLLNVRYDFGGVSMVVVQDKVKTRKFNGTRVGLLKLKPTKGVFDPSTNSIYTWTAPNIHHIGVTEHFPNKNVAHLLIYALDKSIEIQYPSDAPILLEQFSNSGGFMKDWYNYYCSNADKLFAYDIELLSNLYPEWTVTARKPRKSN